ncbi:pectin lyase fold/virulence factor [Cladorrhinum sp. PSN259]|nr:pectin lyase fold/virulence factor [Cladorrhinum sp. PSN259]
MVKRQEGQEAATYDEACNIGFCSVWGATIGGWGATYTTVRTADEFASAVSGKQEGVIIVEGNITSAEPRTIEVGSSKSIVGAPESSLSGISLLLSGSGNVILRNLKLVDPAPGYFAISLNAARSVWVDHCDLSGDEVPYLLSIINGTDYVTVTHNKFYSHVSQPFPAVNVGHVGENVDNAKQKLHITFARNYFSGVQKAIDFRYGTGHIFNSYFENLTQGVDITDAGQVFIEGSVFDGIGINKAVYSSHEDGFVTIKDSVFAGGQYGQPDGVKQGSLDHESIGYPYDWFLWEGTSGVKEGVKRWAGQSLEFLVWEEGTAGEPW